MTGANSLITLVKEKRYFIVLLVLSVILIVSLWFLTAPDHVQPSGVLQKPAATVQHTTQVSVSPKQAPSDPDMVLKQTYVAKVNGKTVQVPLKDGKVDGKTATVTQTIDVSALVKPLVPKWEIGIGVGHNGSTTYFPVSVQRNYKVGRGVEVEAHIGTDGQLKGAAIQHKWCF